MNIELDETKTWQERFNDAIEIISTVFPEPGFVVCPMRKEHCHDIMIYKDYKTRSNLIGQVYVGEATKRTDYHAYSLFVLDGKKREQSKYKYFMATKDSSTSDYRTRLDTFEECITELARLYNRNW